MVVVRSLASTFDAGSLLAVAGVIFVSAILYFSTRRVLKEEALRLSEMMTLTLNSLPAAAVLKSPPQRFSISPGFSAFALLLVLSVLSFGQSISGSDESTITIDSAPDMEVISFSKTVIVKREAKGVLVFGGDVIVEGRVDDVAAIGGSVFQREGSYIGGDVIVVGGKYAPDSKEP